ncbi:MAG: lysozyme [Ruminococcus sp.]|nr:lysozyme [Ruminococcus sp.]
MTKIRKSFLTKAVSLLLILVMMISIMPFAEISVSAKTSADFSISDNGIAFICAREGFHSNCYKDNTQSSIGYGTKCTGSSVQPHTSGSHSITRERALAEMKSQVDSTYSPRVRCQTTGITMNQTQFDALVSLCYNTGGGTTIISNSPLVKYLRGSYSESQARTAYSCYYVKSGGTTLQGLINRRNAEADLFFSGSSPDPVDFEIDTRYPTPITAYPAANSGKITVYNNSLTAYSQSTRFIAWDDKCTINAIYTNGYCNVTYPSGNSTHTEFVKTSDFIPNGVTPYSWHSNENKNTFIRSDLNSLFGSISSSDYCTIVGKNGNTIQIIYPLDAGGFKLGWVDATVVPASDFPTPMIDTLHHPVTSTHTLPSIRWATLMVKCFLMIDALLLL